MSATASIRSPHLRPINPRRDLAQVADLVELCFAEWMDEEGRMYIRQMRQAAREASMLRPVGMRVEGFVWEDRGRIIGNATLIPFPLPNRLLYLIANVAVHPDFRRLGIARQLTHAGMIFARERKAQATWLQVREDNEGAITLYRLLGFVERASRTTWQRDPQPVLPATNGREPVEVGYRRSRSWANQLEWLKQTYPDSVRWNMHFEPEQLRPTLWDNLIGWLFGGAEQQWEARQNNRPIGFASWAQTRQLADPIWLAAEPEQEDVAVNALLSSVVHKLGTRRPLLVNYPAGRAASAFENNGFSHRHTLLWMEAPFRKPAPRREVT